MAHDVGTHVASTRDASDHDVCTCAHLRLHHRGGHCMASLAKSGKGSANASTASICPCGRFDPSGVRWKPPDSREDLKLLRGSSKVLVEHPVSL